MEAILDFLKFFLPLAGAAAGWIWNERRKRINEEYARKEQKYALLVESLQGFYEHRANTEQGQELKSQFLLELNKCWLYCPDNVIRNAYAFLSMVQKGGDHSQPEREKAVGELMVAIRRDLLNRKPVRKTDLGPDDFKHLMVRGDAT